MQSGVQGVQTFWAMRDIGGAERGRARRPALPRPEELARRTLPHPTPRQLNTNQIDPVSRRAALLARLTLQQPLFDPPSAARSTNARQSGSSTARWTTTTRWLMRTNIDGMFDTLKGQITAIPPQDYTQCRSFLQSLLYATTRTMF